MLLSTPDSIPFAELTDPLPAPTSIPSRRQPCLYLQEPLVPVSGIPNVDAYSRLGILPPRFPTLRASAQERLHRARSQLNPPFDLVVLDGSRTLLEQLSLVHYYGNCVIFRASAASDRRSAASSSKSKISIFSLMWTFCEERGMTTIPRCIIHLRLT